MNNTNEVSSGEELVNNLNPLSVNWSWIFITTIALVAIQFLSSLVSRFMGGYSIDTATFLSLDLLLLPIFLAVSVTIFIYSGVKRGIIYQLVLSFLYLFVVFSLMGGESKGYLIFGLLMPTTWLFFAIFLCGIILTAFIFRWFYNKFGLIGFILANFVFFLLFLVLQTGGVFY